MPLSVPIAWLQNGATALLVTAQTGHLEVVDLLLRHGANVQHEDQVIRGKG